MNGIALHISHGFLAISKGLKKTKIRKPTRSLWKQPVLLEQLFEEVIKQATTQCLEHYTEEYKENLKNELFKQLTGLNI